MKTAGGNKTLVVSTNFGLCILQYQFTRQDEFTNAIVAQLLLGPLSAFCLELRCALKKGILVLYSDTKISCSIFKYSKFMYYIQVL